MKTALRWFLIVAAALVVLILAIPFLVSADRFRPLLQSNLTSALARDVSLGELKLALWVGGVTATDLAIAEDPAFGKPVFLKAKEFRVAVEMLPLLLSRKLHVTAITIDQPEIVLVQTPQGTWNFSSLGAKAGSAKASSSASPVSAADLNLSVQRIGVTNGRLTVRRTAGHWKPLMLEGVEAEVRDFSASAAFPFTATLKVAGGGTMKLTGTAGPINQADAAMTPVNATLNITGLDLAASGVNDWAPTVAGVLALDGTLKSDGSHASISGKVTVDKLKLARNSSPAKRAVEFVFNTDYDLRNHSGRLNRGDLHIGQALASLTGTYAEQGEAMVLNMNVAGSSMPISDLTAMLPAIGVVLPAGSSLEGGAANAKISIQGPADRLISAGAMSVNNTRLAGFDLGKKMSAMERLAGLNVGPNTDIQTLSVNARYAPEGATFQQLKLVVPAIGELDGSGTMSPAEALAFKMTATVHTGGFVAAMNDKPIPFTVEGTASDPVFRPNVGAIVKDELNGIGGDAGKAATGLIRGLLGGGKK